MSKGPNEVRRYYYKLVNEEFRNLQLDNNLKNKSVFDLIDYCELLYENLAASTSGDHKALRFYIRGYLIFNYFINSFIMLHFHGFDEFIKSNEYDFIIYLNVFAFYNTDEYINNSDYLFPLNDLRKLVLDYLETKNLLKFDVNELYRWLYEYIDYLKQKDRSEAVSSDSDEDIYTETFRGTTQHATSYSSDSDDSEASIEKFTQRFPSLKLEKDLPQAPLQTPSQAPLQHAPSQPPPPVPSALPPVPSGLPPVPSSALSDPDLSIPVHKSPKAVPYPVETLVQETPYPIKNDVLERKVPLERYNSSPTVTTRPPIPPPQPPIPQSQPPVPQLQPLAPHLQPQASQLPGPQYQQPPQGLVRPHTFSNGHFNYPNNYQRPPMNYNPPAQYMNGPGPVHINPHAELARQRRSQQMQELAICGLKNFGSSCYINSTIQVLLGVEQFKSLFYNLKYHKYIKDPKFLAAKNGHGGHHKDSVMLSEGVSGLVKSFALHGGASIAPTKFIRISSLLKPDLNIPYEQQDTQEFLLFILDRLHEELSDKTKGELTVPLFEQYIHSWNINVPEKDFEGYFKWFKSLLEYEGVSPIHDMFEGHLQNKLICNKCKYESISYSPFTILSLPIPANNNDIVDLSDCLRYYTQDEIMSGDNAWNCPKCDKQSSAENALDNHPVFTKKPGIFKFSKRSKSPSKEPKKKGTSISIKRLNFIKLPPVLFIHLSRFSMYNLTDKLNTVISYPLELKFNSNGHFITYRLLGLINHYGNLKSGHYTALVDKHPQQQYWCYFDDETVRLHVGHLDPDSKSRSRDVYVLCYERVQ